MIVDKNTLELLSSVSVFFTGTQQTSMFPGIEKLAHATGAMVVYIHILKTARGQYSAECQMISVDPRLTKETEITRNYAQLLERNIQEQPSSWLWTHKRWKR